MKAFTEHVEVVEAAPLVALGSTEQDDVDTACAADAAGAVLPGPRSQCLRIETGAVIPSVPEGLVLRQCIDDIVQASSLPVEVPQCFKAALLELPGQSLVHLASLDACLQPGVALHLGDPDSSQRAIEQVVVVPVVLERLAKWGRAIEAGHAVCGEHVH